MVYVNHVKYKNNQKKKKKKKLIPYWLHRNETISK